MATYMVQASFTSDAWAKLCKHPEDRRAVIAKHMEVFGGKLLSFYYCIGEYDVVLISEAPDDTAFMAAVASSISAGHIKSTKTTKLMTSDQAIAAMAEAGKAAYAPPSG